jgi:hypothetical protein
MLNVQGVIEQIDAAFAAVKYPGDWCLRGGNEGDEPYLLEEEFKGKADWHALDPKFLDRAPAGYASALSFFSDEAFHFFLPAYLIADLRGQLECSDPVFHLTHGLDDSSRGELVNPRRFGQRTWLEERRHKFAIFGREEAAAVVAYLKLKSETDEFERDRVDQALRNYWNERASLPNVASAARLPVEGL